MIEKIIVSILMVIILWPPITFADELLLVKGKGVPVCEAHFKNLESLELNEMVCQRDESYSEANGITRPTWQELDLRENKELIKRIHKFFAIGNQFGTLKIIDDEKEFEKYFNDHILKYNSLKKTTLDMANNGKTGIVMLYREPRCDVNRNISYNIPYSRPLFAYDEATNIVDIKKTEPLLQNPFPRDIKAKAVNSGYQLYDIFIYNNNTYFDKWNVYDWTLVVYHQLNYKVKEVCRYQYKKTKQEGLKR